MTHRAIRALTQPPDVLNSMPYQGRRVVPLPRVPGDQPPVRIGQRLRRLRRARGKTLEVIAGLAGISTSYLMMLEKGDRSVYRLPLIICLAEALGVPPMELVKLAAEDCLRTCAVRETRVASDELG